MKAHRPLRNALSVLLHSPDTRAPAYGPHVRDVIDLKRTMAIVLLALSPCIVSAFAHYGLSRLLPLFVVSYGVGLAVEWLFSLIRGTEINEGYLVTGALIPLIVPITIPLWQLALAVVFALVFAKEAFGGTGHNIFNPALVCRAFLFFAYPAQMTGAVWEPPSEHGTADSNQSAPELVYAVSSATAASMPQASTSDAVSAATPLALAKSAPSGGTRSLLDEAGYTTSAMLEGRIPGSPGERNKLAILLGALLLLLTGIASARIMLAGVVGLLLTATLATALAASPTGLFAVSAWQHLLMGGFLFGIVFMATDPVTHPETNVGKWVFGFLCGAFTIMIRLYNPAYVEGTMLAILLMNAFAPALDRAVLAVHIRQRRARRGT